MSASAWLSLVQTAGTQLQPAGSDRKPGLCTPELGWETVGLGSCVWLCVCVWGTFLKAFSGPKWKYVPPRWTIVLYKE